MAGGGEDGRRDGGIEEGSGRDRPPAFDEAG